MTDGRLLGALADGGVSHHYMPSRNHPYSRALWLFRPCLQVVLIRWLRPEAEAVIGYPTHFDHCTTSQMEKLFQEQGFQQIRIKPFYRATDYYAFFLPAYLACSLFENLVERLGVRAFASGFVISAQE